MSKENDPDGDSELLFKIYENLIRTEEKLKALTEANQKDHDIIKNDIKKIEELHSKFEERLNTVEHSKFQLDWTWKTIIFLMGLIPTVLAILSALQII